MLDDVVQYYKDNPTYMKIFGWWQKHHIKSNTPTDTMADMLCFIVEPVHEGTIGGSEPPSLGEAFEFLFRDREAF